MKFLKSKQKQITCDYYIYIYAWDRKSKKLKTREWKIQTSGSRLPLGPGGRKNKEVSTSWVSD